MKNRRFNNDFLQAESELVDRYHSAEDMDADHMGEFVSAEDMDADADADMEAAGGAAAKLTSKPYIVTIYNSTANPVSGVKLLNATVYGYDDMASWKAAFPGLSIACSTYANGAAFTSYAAFLRTTAQKPFTNAYLWWQAVDRAGTGLTAGASLTFNVNFFNINGDAKQTLISPAIAKDQYNTFLNDSFQAFVVDGDTEITINEPIYSGSTVTVRFYPSKIATPKHNLTGKKLVVTQSDPKIGTIARYR